MGTDYESERMDIVLRYFGTMSSLWADYQDALRKYTERKTWLAWLALIITKSTYETYKAERDAMLRKLQCRHDKA